MLGGDETRGTRHEQPERKTEGALSRYEPGGYILHFFLHYLGTLVSHNGFFPFFKTTKLLNVAAGACAFSQGRN